MSRRSAHGAVSALESTRDARIVVRPDVGEIVLEIG